MGRALVRCNGHQLGVDCWRMIVPGQYFCDGPDGCFDYTMPVLATTERLVRESPDIAAAAVRALVAAQNALKADVSRATAGPVPNCHGSVARNCAP